MRLVFFEKWRDRRALEAHFRVPESIGFIAAVRRDAMASSGPDIYEVVA